MPFALSLFYDEYTFKKRPTAICLILYRKYTIKKKWFPNFILIVADAGSGAKKKCLVPVKGEEKDLVREKENIYCKKNPLRGNGRVSNDCLPYEKKIKSGSLAFAALLYGLSRLPSLTIACHMFFKSFDLKF
ncbi:MAG: hypothetical protein H7Y31_03060 [Chitinophagaceae bacterium]|nr:hypothetical protein [Chitinophagaceae bacterium]